jgi:alanine dehydrogenase
MIADAGTRILSGSDVERLLDMDSCIDAVSHAFALHAAGASLKPATLAIEAAPGTVHVKAAGLLIGERRFIVAKTNVNIPGNPERRGLPTIQGVLVLCDADSGFPLAVMDSIAITTRRTAAATAVAARYLAREDAGEATVYGCGEQAFSQIEALSRVRPVQRVHLFDRDAGRAEAAARLVNERLGILAAATRDPVGSMARSRLCVTCTTSTKAILFRGDVQPGTFVAAVGADNPHKHELAPGLMAAATVVVDLLESCAANGDLHHAIAAGVMSRDDVHAELADLVAGQIAGRTSPDEITVFDSTGTALQDVAAAVMAYDRSVAAGAGLTVLMRANGQEHAELRADP